MNTQRILNRGVTRTTAAILATVTLAVMMNLPTARAAITLYTDNFQSYPVQNPAPNPLTNGPAGGQWVFVDPIAPFTVQEHRIFDATTGGSGLNSRCWISLTNNARLTNAISISSLPAGTNLYTFRLSFVAATDTAAAGRNNTFQYAISSTAGTLAFVSGGNQDNSQPFTGLSGFGLASSGAIGKTPDRRFEIVFQGTNLTTADKIIFDITRVTNNAGAAVFFALDDVLLLVDDGKGPVAQSARAPLTMEHVRVSFSEPVEPASATNIINYVFTGNALSVQSARLIDPAIVELLTSAQSPGSNYVLQVSNVLGQTGVSMITTQLNFTTPNLVVSSVRYDAGTTVTQPGGPPDPTTAAGGYWLQTTNTNNGMTFGAVVDDLSTGLNAWMISDQNVLAAGGILDYRMVIDQPSDALARSNGWRFLFRSRMVSDYASAAATPVVVYGDSSSGQRYGMSFDLDASGNLTAALLGGATYILTDSSTATAYHTHVIAFDPALLTASYYFDGRLIVTNYPGQANAAYNGIAFGTGSSTGTGEMNFNLLQFDVIGGTQPVVTLNPQSSTNGVGQKVTFTAGFTPFVGAYQWLSNGIIIPRATNNTYITDFITLEYNLTQYRCRALHFAGNVETTAATLTVTSDTTAPTIAAIKGSLLLNRVVITYSEPVLEAFATNIANYVWAQPGVTNLTAKLLDPVTVELRTTPQASGSNYTVRVSNVRDWSNLTITPNTPASFTTSKLTLVGRYDAGTTNTQPAGPSDPTSVAGGGWTLTMGTNTDLSTNAVVDDQSSGWHAWQVRDATTASGQFIQYVLPTATNVDQAAKQNGWVFTVRSRLTEDFGTTGALFAQYADYNFYRYVLQFDADNNGALTAGLWGTNGYAISTVTDVGVASTDYHLHQAVYDPASGTASYYVDGELVVAGWFGGFNAGSHPGLFFGAESSANMGAMNFNLVELKAVEPPVPPFLNISLNSGNIEIRYTDVLEAASQVSGTYSGVATNSSGTTNTYVIPPASQQSQQFFRVRKSQ